MLVWDISLEEKTKIMKKLILLIALYFIGFEMNAQVQKGDSNFGTNFGLISQKGDDPIMSYSYTYFSLGYQYYLSNNISIGVAPAVTSTKVLDKSVTVNSSAINLFIDYSFLSTKGKVLPYFGFKYTSMTTNMKWDDATAATGFLTGIVGDQFGLDSLANGLGGGGFNLGGILGGFNGSTGGLEAKYKRTIMSLSLGLKFFVTERLNVDNNFTIGNISKEEISTEFAGFPITASANNTGTFMQFTVGFGYIIGRKGT